MTSHTIIIIALTCVISYIAFSNDTVRDRLIFWPPAINKGQVERFFTHGLIHADVNHLMFNMITLFFFGSAIENLYKPYAGGLGFALFYMFGVIVAILPSYFANKNNSEYASLGASGAVSAVLFAYILIAPWSMLYLFFIIPMPAIVFAAAYTAYSVWAQKKGNDNINHSAHLWGAAFGVLATIAIKPSLAVSFFGKLMSPSF